MRWLTALAVALLSGCASTPDASTLEEHLPLCPDQMSFAERDLANDQAFVASEVVYRLPDGALCRGI